MNYEMNSPINAIDLHLLKYIYNTYIKYLPRWLGVLNFYPSDYHL